MTSFEVILLLIGLACVVVSFIMGNDEPKKDNVISTELTEEQKDIIRKQVQSIIDEEVITASEKTEVSLDKISNTKILEMNEYAENVLGQINRNHNETVFLYDMLNEKAKEVKTTVKDVNVTRRQVEKMQAEVANEAMMAEPVEGNDENGGSPEKVKAPEEAVKTLAPKQAKSTTKTQKPRTKKTTANTESVGESKNIAKERLHKVVAADEKELSGAQNMTNLSEEDKMDAALREAKGEKKKSTTRRSTKKTTRSDVNPPEEVTEMNIQFEKGSNNNENILKMYKDGKTNKEIAKELNLGIGEVKLVIDLYNSTK